jgi:hypothetical protein
MSRNICKAFAHETDNEVFAGTAWIAQTRGPGSCAIVGQSPPLSARWEICSAALFQITSAHTPNRTFKRGNRNGKKKDE